MRLKRSEYYSYIRSEAWQQVRRRFFKSKLYHGCCAACQRRDVPIELHHRTYRRLGYEWLSDLIPLCRDCHERTHAIYDSNEDKSGGLYGVHKAVRGELRRKKKTAGFKYKLIAAHLLLNSRAFSLH